MYSLNVTYAAETDLEDILSYLSLELDNKTAVQQLLAGIELCYSRLTSTPYLYERCQDSRLRQMGYRRAVIHHYVMIYRIDESSHCVHILRFFHGSRDYERLI